MQCNFYKSEGLFSRPIPKNLNTMMCIVDGGFFWKVIAHQPKKNDVQG
jgi:hypothetical protein